MDNNLEKTIDTKSCGNTDSTKNEKSSRVKRMRGWLGIKSSVESHNLGGGGDILIDVDAPNGWNR